MLMFHSFLSLPIFLFVLISRMENCPQTFRYSKHRYATTIGVKCCQRQRTTVLAVMWTKRATSQLRWKVSMPCKFICTLSRVISTHGSTANCSLVCMYVCIYLAVIIRSSVGCSGGRCWWQWRYFFKGNICM